ncbi:MAG: hypothetical protein HY096_12755 [Nitrospinae bacterium]|nr:hypothetical protein [Nitrospinota bacterium]
MAKWMKKNDLGSSEIEAYKHERDTRKNAVGLASYLNSLPAPALFCSNLVNKIASPSKLLTTGNEVMVVRE